MSIQPCKCFQADARFVSGTSKYTDGKKDPSKTYRVGEAVFELWYQHENSYTGETFDTLAQVPFKIFGDGICNLIDTLKTGDECHLFFEVSGNLGSGQYQGRVFGQNKLSAVKRLGPPLVGSLPKINSEEDIPFL